MKLVTNLTPEEAKSVLQQLLKQRPGLTKEVGDITAKLKPAVDSEEVAMWVRDELENLEIDDVWERSGEDRYGYTAPYDAADEIMGEVIDSYMLEVRKFEDLKRPDDADAYLAGIIMGLNQFDNEVESPVKELADESAAAFASTVLAGWKKAVRNDSRVTNMQERLVENCAGWENLVVLALR